MFDVILVGAGVIGAHIARELSKYQLQVLVIEKNSDVGDEASGANSAIIHSGYDPLFGSLKAELNVLGNKMFDTLCNDLDVDFARNGSLTIATTKEECETLKELYQNGLQNGVDLKLIGGSELFEMESLLTKRAQMALYAKDAGIVNPFELVVALMENAIDNGIILHLDEKVIDIKNNENDYTVITNIGHYQTKMVINCAGVHSDEISNYVNSKQEEILPRKGEYYVLDHFNKPFIKHTLFSIPSSAGKGILVTPTTHGNYLIGPSSDFVFDKEDKKTTPIVLKNVLENAKRLVDDVPMQYLIREFSGLRAYHESNDFVIKQEKPGFINVLGIQSPGLASSPAIALKVLELVKNNVTLTVNESFKPERKKIVRINRLSIIEREELISKNPLYGEMVCRCEKVSHQEVIDSINRNCGARTIKGVKKRVRPGFGKCQGGFCEVLIMKILSETLGKNLSDINYSNQGSYILAGKTKEDSFHE